MRSLKLIAAAIIFSISSLSSLASADESKSAAALAVATAHTFKLAFEDGFADIELNRRCLTRDQSSPSEFEEGACKERREYFLNIIPREWKRFRFISSLSKWSSKFELRLDDSPPFNFELENQSFARAEDGKVEPLEGDELVAAKAEWKIQWDLARSAAIKDLIEQITRIRAIRGGIGPNEQQALTTAEEARVMIETWPIRRLARVDNLWVKRTFRRVQYVTFKLNRKRMIQALARHPILAHFNSKTLSQPELLRAFDRQQNLLETERKVIAEKYAKLAQITPNALKYRDLFFVFDYVLVVEKALADHPELRESADATFDQMILREQIKSGIILTAMIAVAPFIPVSISLFGVVGIQAVALKNAYAAERSAKDLAYSSSSSEISLKSVDDVYMAETNVGSEWLLAAAIGPAVPLLRLTRLSKLLRMP